MTSSLLLLCALFPLTFFALVWPIHHDAAIYVRCGQLLLDGKIPYVDFVDINPPLIMYLNVVPALLSRTLHMDAIAAFNICIWLSCVASWAACLSVLKSEGEENNQAYAGPLLLSVAAYSFVVGMWGEFGGREHLFALAYFPFTLLRRQRFSGATSSGKPATACIIGLCFALAVLIRPHYVLMPLTLEVFFLFRTRALKMLLTPEIVAACLITLAYMLHFAFLPSTMNEAYFHRYLPLVTTGYAAFGCSWEKLLTVPLLTGVFPLFMLALILLNRSSQKNEAFAWALILQTMAAYVAFAVQAKGWFGHCLPIAAAASLLYAVALTPCGNKSAKSHSSLRNALLLLAGIALCLLPWVVFKKVFMQQQWDTQNELIMKETAVNDSVMVLTSGVPDAFPSILKTNRPFAGRYFFLFPLSIAVYMEQHAESKDKVVYEEEEKRVLAELKEDIEKLKPTLILIQYGASDSQKQASIQTYLTEKGLIPQALTGYKYIGECRSYSVMSAYKRIAQ